MTSSWLGSGSGQSAFAMAGSCGPGGQGLRRGLIRFFLGPSTICVVPPFF